MKTSPFFMRIMLGIGAFITLGISIYCIYTYNRVAKQEAYNLQKINKDSLQHAIHILDEAMFYFMKIGDKLADLAGGSIGHSSAYMTLLADMQKTLEENPTIYSVSASFAPYQFDPNTRFHSIQFTHEPSGITQTTLETWYDYTTTSWYNAGQTMKAQWIDPMFDASLNKNVITYVIPILTYDEKTRSKKFSGVFALDFVLDYVDTLVSSFNLQKESYAMLVTRNGLIVAHPTSEYVNKGMTLFDLASMPGNKAFIQLGNVVSRTPQGEMTFTIPDSLHGTYKALFSTLSRASWVLIIVGPEKEAFIPNKYTRRLLINCVLSVLLFCILVFALMFRIYTGTTRALWLTSSGCAILIFASICMIWLFYIISTENQLSHTNIIDSEIALNRFFFLHKKTNPLLYKHDIHFIPTGLYLYAVTLEATNPFMTLHGHIWQKYNIKKDASLEKSVIIFNGIEQSFEKVYEDTQDDIYTIGWRFHTKIKGNFAYTRYPFDQQNLILALGHKNYTQAIILTPDFDAFTGMHNANPEIDPMTNTSPWTIISTYSFYDLTHFNTDFGIKNYSHQTDFPTLCFNIAVHRDFVYPFMRSFLPIAIILLVAFSILLIIGLSEKTTKLAPTVLSLCSGLLFATILSHQTFQRSVESSRLTYFEYFYFIVYGVILLITVNGILYSLNRGGFFINYNNNLSARIVYWPFVLTIFLIITLIFFY